MLHEGAEKKEHTILFLELIKKYVPLDWNTTRMMSDQAKSFESAHMAVFHEPIYTCSVHLLRNIIIHTKGHVTALFHKMVHTLVDQVREEAQGKILDMFHDKVPTRKLPTYEKVCNQTNMHCQNQRRNGFEQYTTNPVEQFHSTIKSVKEVRKCWQSGISIINDCFSTFNALSKGEDVDEPRLSGFGRVVISLNIAMALTMKVEKQGRTRIVSQNKDYNVSLHRIFKDYMDGLKRKESYSRCRIAYIDSLIECVASEVTETKCSLCKEDTSYCYCPHILAVRLHVSFAKICGRLLLRTDGLQMTTLPLY